MKWVMPADRGPNWSKEFAASVERNRAAKYAGAESFGRSLTFCMVGIAILSIAAILFP